MENVRSILVVSLMMVAIAGHAQRNDIEPYGVCEVFSTEDAYATHRHYLWCETRSLKLVTYCSSDHHELTMRHKIRDLAGYFLIALRYQFDDNTSRARLWWVSPATGVVFSRNKGRIDRLLNQLKYAEDMFMVTVLRQGATMVLINSRLHDAHSDYDSRCSEVRR